MPTRGDAAAEALELMSPRVKRARPIGAKDLDQMRRAGRPLQDWLAFYVDLHTPESPAEEPPWEPVVEAVLLQPTIESAAVDADEPSWVDGNEAFDPDALEVIDEGDAALWDALLEHAEPALAETLAGSGARAARSLSELGGSASARSTTSPAATGPTRPRGGRITAPTSGRTKKR